MALQDERNFRSAYYEKVGFRSVEEKKSLEILLKERPVDVGKLKQFCLRFSVPSTYRNLVWSLLLGVLPACLDAHAFILEQRVEEFSELQRGLKVLQLMDDTTLKYDVYVSVYTLERNHYMGNIATWPQYVKFAAISRTLAQYFDSDIDVYWLAKSFCKHTDSKKEDRLKLVYCTWQLLEKEDATLYNYIQKYSLFDDNCLLKWYDVIFAGVLCETALAKIWDKICGGSFKILPFVVIILLINQRHKLLKSTEQKSAMDHLNYVSEDISEIIVNKAIDMWQHYGSPLAVHDKLKVQSSV